MMYRRRIVSASALALLAIVTGCGDDVTVPMPSADMSEVGAPAPPMESPAVMSLSKTAGDVSAVSEQSIAGSASSVVAPSMVIRNGSATLEVDSLEPAIAAVQQMATRFGGYVGNSSFSSTEYRSRSATLELKIPAARFDSALAGLEPIGDVESITSTAEDVGEEFVDMSARVANAKRLEERLISLLATRAGKLEDVLAVERELARVREEIERYSGRLRYLQTRVAISTLAVTVHEPAPLVSSSAGENVIMNAFRESWRNFVSFVAGFIAWLGVIVPLGGLLAIGVWGWRKARRPKG
jgi:hypothetical protein